VSTVAFIGVVVDVHLVAVIRGFVFLLKQREPNLIATQPDNIQSMCRGLRL